MCTLVKQGVRDIIDVNISDAESKTDFRKCPPVFEILNNEWF